MQAELAEAIAKQRIDEAQCDAMTKQAAALAAQLHGLTGIPEEASREFYIKEMAERANEVRALKAERDEFLACEHRLSDAYVRIRSLVDAFDTPFAPTLEQITELTETKLKAIIAQRDKLQADLDAVRSEKNAHVIALAIVKADKVRLREALRRYGAHDDYCQYLTSCGQFQCDCGWQAALKEAK